MKRLIFTAAALALVAGCATSQPPAGYGGPRYDPGTFWRGAPESPHERIDVLERRIGDGLADGSLSREEANRVKRQISDLRHWARRASDENGGRLYPPQEAEIQHRLDKISHEIRWLRNGGR